MVGKVEAYAALGAALKNERWAWSGHSEDEATVVVTLWADKLREVPGGGTRYDLFDAPDLEAWRTKRGNRERIRDLLLAREKSDGLFKVVIGRANESGEAMAEGSLYEASDIVMRLIDLDERTGEFSAESV